MSFNGVNKEMNKSRYAVTAGCVWFLIAFLMLGLELTHVVPFSKLYSIAITFAFVVAGLLMMIAFSRTRRAK